MVETRAGQVYRAFKDEVLFAKDFMDVEVDDLAEQTASNHLALATLKRLHRMKCDFALTHMPAAVWAGCPVLSAHGVVHGCDHCPARDGYVPQPDDAVGIWAQAPKNEWECRLAVHVKLDLAPPGEMTYVITRPDDLCCTQNVLADRVRENLAETRHFVAVWNYRGTAPTTIEDYWPHGGNDYHPEYFYEEPHAVYAVYLWDTPDMRATCIWGLPVNE